MRLRTLLIIVASARVGGAQTAQGAARGSGIVVSGVVFDSLMRAPLAGAMVQLVMDGPTPAGRSVVSDSLGRFTIDSVRDGRYMLGFFHPVLDSIGIEPPPREVIVSGGHATSADLAVPSPARLRAAACGGRQSSDSSGIIIGSVHAVGDRSPVVGASVVGEWVELSLSARGWSRGIGRRVATTGRNGWFALCDVPNAGTVSLSARAAADSTPRIDVDVPAGGFLRRELYVGRARATIHGVVTSAEAKQPLAGAQVSVADAPPARTDARGEWTIADVPAGTRMVEVRAIGFLPDRRAVDVLPDAPPVRSALSTMKAVLDTVKVNALSSRARELAGFNDRRRTTTGKFFTAEDVERRKPLQTSDLFRSVPGLYLERDGMGGRTLKMRNVFGDQCSPAVYVDGHFMRDVGPDDIDSWASPEEIAGLEIYAGTEVPAQFGTGMAGVANARLDAPAQLCGSIVIWTRQRSRARP